MLTQRHFLPCLLLLLLARPALAQEVYGCPDYETPSVTVRPLMTSPRYDNARSLPELQAIATDSNLTLAGSQHEIPVGLTAASMRFTSKYEVKVHTRPGNAMVCAQIAQFELTFGFDDTTVFLARELPYGSCSYETVLEHETRHVGTDQSLVGIYLPYFPDVLREALRQIGMIRAGSGPEAEAQLKAIISKYVAELGANLSEVRQRQQAKIDTQDEYDRLSHSCNGEMAAIIRAAKAGAP